MFELFEELWRFHKFELCLEQRCNFCKKLTLSNFINQLISIWENLLGNLKPDNLMKYRESSIFNRKNSKVM